MNYNKKSIDKFKIFETVSNFLYIFRFKFQNKRKTNNNKRFKIY